MEEQQEASGATTLTPDFEFTMSESTTSTSVTTTSESEISTTKASGEATTSKTSTSRGTISKPSSASRKKHEEKHRKRDPRSWENVTKAISTMELAEKFSYIEKKYQELYYENRNFTHSQHIMVKQLADFEKEVDSQKSDLTKSMVARSRLENLCRELQKQNKLIKDENMAKIKEEEDHRKEVSASFAEKLGDINKMMEENKEKSDVLREENVKMTAKLAELYEQFQKREHDISRMSQQLELEREYAKATLAKMELELKAEKEMHAKEQELLRNSLEKSEANCSILLETVKGQQEHIDVYKTQYEDFESTMSKSAKVFDSFKTEIANMTQQVATLEKEAQTWKNKFHDSMRALVEMSEVKKNQELYIQGLDRKLEQLQKLCRQLQADRANYLKLLKSNGIELPSDASKEKAEEEAKVKSSEMTKKEKELQTLKDSLQAMQDELSKLNIEDVNKTDEKKTDSDVAVEQSAKVPEKETAPKEEANSGETTAPEASPGSNLDAATAELPENEQSGVSNDEPVEGQSQVQ